MSKVLYEKAMSVIYDKNVALNFIEKDGSLFEHLPIEFRSDKDIAKAAIISYPEAFKYASEDIKADRGFIIEMLTLDADIMFEYASEEIRNDAILAKMAAYLSGHYISGFSENLLSDKVFIEQCIDLNDVSATAYIYATDEVRADKELAIKAVSELGSLLQYASKGLKSNKSIVRAAVNNSSEALQYASNSLLLDKNFIKEILTTKGGAFAYLPNSLKVDKEIVKCAVEQDAYMIKYVYRELLHDEEFVKQLICKNPKVLGHIDVSVEEKWLSEIVKTNTDVAVAILDLLKPYDVFPDAIKGRKLPPGLFVSEEAISGIVKNRNYMCEIVSKSGKLLAAADPKLRDDKELVMKAVKVNGSALRFASLKLQNDCEIVMEAMKKNPEALKYAGNFARANKSVVLEAVKIDGYAIKYAEGKLQYDTKLAIEAVKNSRRALKYLPEKMKNNREVVLESIKKDPYTLKFAAETLRADYEIVMLAVSKAGRTLEYASKELRADIGVVKAAISESSYAYRYALGEAKEDEEIKERAYIIPDNIGQIYDENKEKAVELAKRSFYRFSELPDRIKNDKDFQDAFLKVWSEQSSKADFYGA